MNKILFFIGIAFIISGIVLYIYSNNIAEEEKKKTGMFNEAYGYALGFVLFFIFGVGFGFILKSFFGFGFKIFNWVF